MTVRIAVRVTLVMGLIAILAAVAFAAPDQPVLLQPQAVPSPARWRCGRGAAARRRGRPR